MKKIDPSLFTIKPLTPLDDVSDFFCSVDDLNEYLKEDALQDQRYLFSITKILMYENKAIGYFTLVNDTIEPSKVDDEIWKKYDYSKLPALKIARLATDKNFVGCGVGTVMMRFIFHVVFKITMDVGCRILTVDARQDAQSFYEHFAFRVVKSKKKYATVPMYLDILPLIETSL